MLAWHEIDSFLRSTPEPLREIALELRNIILATCEDAVEVIRWGGLGYFHAGRGGMVSAGICQIGIHEDHIRLAFIHGAFLPDPQHLLEGERKAKRFVRLNSFEDVPWDDLEELIRQSAQFDPRSLQDKPGT